MCGVPVSVGGGTGGGCWNAFLWRHSPPWGDICPRPPPHPAFMILPGNIQRAGLVASFQAWDRISTGASFHRTMRAVGKPLTVPLGKLLFSSAPSHACQGSSWNDLPTPLGAARVTRELLPTAGCLGHQGTPAGCWHPQVGSGFPGEPG